MLNCYTCSTTAVKKIWAQIMIGLEAACLCPDTCDMFSRRRQILFLSDSMVTLRMSQVNLSYIVPQERTSSTLSTMFFALRAGPDPIKYFWRRLMLRWNSRPLIG